MRKTLGLILLILVVASCFARLNTLPARNQSADLDLTTLSHEALTSLRYVPVQHESPTASGLPTLFGTGYSGSGQRLAAGQPEPHWILAGYQLPPGGRATGGTLYRAHSPLFCVRGYFGNPAISPDARSDWGGNNPQNGVYGYRTTFTANNVYGTARINGDLTCDDAVLSMFLNGRPVSLGFDGPGTERSIDGVTRGRFHERASFQLDTPIVNGVNTLDVVTANQDLGPNPHSLQVRFE